ncbi:MAG: GerA spore germination protein [Bacilli bacterium]|nr:GerA spore germination protein [Bacilli bacterium]
MADFIMNDQLKQSLHNLLQSDDVEYREMSSDNKHAIIIYVRTVCDSEIIREFVVKPFWEIESESQYTQFIQSFPESSELTDQAGVVKKLLQGYVAIFLANQAFLLDAKKIETSSVETTAVETTVNGPQDKFNENLLISINQLRHRYKRESLRVELKRIGTYSQTNLAIVYDEQIVRKEVLQELKQRLSQVQPLEIQGVAEIAKLLNNQKWSLVPTMLMTERPDRTAKKIAVGKIVLLLDGTSFVLIVPATFSEFYVSMDDEYQLRTVAYFLIVLRYIGLAVTMLLPPLYIATVSYNPEFFRVQLAFSIAASRAAVPYPSFVEVTFMLLMMEFLTEASIRVPKAVGPTATTVGGLILGEAATQAGLVSQIMIIIVAACAIANFVIPVSTMSLAARLFKYPLILFATLFGMLGVVVGTAWFIAYLCNLDSFGTPYFKFFRKADQA